MNAPAEIRALLDELIPRCVQEGARAVVLTGSWARGEPHPYSDVDLILLGEGPEYRPIALHDRLVSMSWRTEAEVEAAFLHPWEVGTFVPGWRTARILHDPEGIARRIVARAQNWSWDALGDAPDRWAAEELAGLAEEGLKLTGALERQQPQAALIQRNLLALRLPGILAVRRRMLYGTEDRLPEQIAKAIGPEWEAPQDLALGAVPVDWKESCYAALRLYALAAQELLPYSESEQEKVIRLALRSVQNPSSSARSAKTAR